MPNEKFDDNKCLYTNDYKCLRHNSKILMIQISYYFNSDIFFKSRFQMEFSKVIAQHMGYPIPCFLC